MVEDKRVRPAERQRRRGGWVAALVAAVVGILLLAACGSSSSGGGSGGASSSSSDTLTIGIVGDSPTSFGLNEECSSPIFQFAYEPLIRVSPKGEYEPGIAESWQYSKNNTVFTMKIRTGIKFQDGTDVTAKSVVDTLNYYKSVPGLNDGYIKPWTVDAQGADSVQISYADPFIGIETILADSGNCNNGMIISAAGLKEPDKLKTQMFGAGPYVYDASQSEPGDHYTYTPNANYYDKSRQNWKKVVLRVIADPNTALNALASGQIQVDMSGGASLAGQARSKGYDVSVLRKSAIALMLWDRGGELTKPLGDVRVRRAMALALDRDSIAKAVGPDVTPQDQFTLTGFTGYDAALPSKYSYNVDEAKQLLSQAGYPDGFSMTLEVNSDAVDQLGKIGIKVTLQAAPNTSFFTDFAAKKYSAGAVSYGLYGVLPGDAYRLYKSPFSDVWNPFRSVDPEIEQAYQALVTSADSTFEENAKKFNEAMTAKVWYVPVVTIPQFVFSKGIEIGSADPWGSFAVTAWKPKS
jgi:peptide/nickel transport system substrate-binding protein